MAIRYINNILYSLSVDFSSAMFCQLFQQIYRCQAHTQLPPGFCDEEPCLERCAACRGRDRRASSHDSGEKEKMAMAAMVMPVACCARAGLGDCRRSQKARGADRMVLNGIREY